MWKPTIALDSRWLTQGQWDVGCSLLPSRVNVFNKFEDIWNEKPLKCWDKGNLSKRWSSEFLTLTFVKSTNHDWSNQWIVKSLLILAVVRLINHWSVRRKTCQNRESSKLLNFNDHYNDEFVKFFNFVDCFELREFVKVHKDIDY